MSFRSSIPNALTSCNLLSGIAGLFFAFSGRPDIAFCLMLAAAAFDFLDGFAARLLKTSSPIGAQLDSLSDAVSFGVLPSVMLSVMMWNGSPGLPWMKFLSALPLLLAVFSALRLAKFNIDDRQHSSFLGLPTPASAILCASLAAYCFIRPESILAGICGSWWAILILTAVLCPLLVCEIPFFSFKGGKDDFKAKAKLTCFGCISAVTVIVAAVLAFHWTAIPFGIAAAYLLVNLIFALFRI